MLQSPTGATIAAMMKTTGWQQHSVRGFLAGVVRKRLKLKLSSKKVDGNRVYRIAGASSGKTGARPSSAVAPERHAARQDRSGAAGPETTRRRDCALARSRRRRASGPLAQRVSAAATPSPAPPSSVSRSGVSAAGRSSGRPGWRESAAARSLGVSGEGRAARRGPEPAHREPEAGHHAGPRMERSDAAGGGAGRRLCLERQDLSQPVEGRLRDHRHPLERPKILRSAGQAIEGGPRHEGRIGEAGSLRDLYPRVDRPGARAGLQLARCPVRCLAGLYPQPGPCRLDAAAGQIRRRRLLGRQHRPAGPAAAAGGRARPARST